PVEFYLDDVMIHGTAESVIDEIQSFPGEIGMTYLMAAPMGGRSFRLLTDKGLPRIGWGGGGGLSRKRVRGHSPPPGRFESRPPLARSDSWRPDRGSGCLI